MSKIVKTKSGNWHTQIYDYTDSNGKRKYKEITAPTKAEVEFLAGQFKLEKATRPKTPNEMNVGQAIDEYIKSCSNISPTTLESYHKIRAKAFQSLMDVPVRKLSQQMVKDAIKDESNRFGEKTGKPLSAKTIKNEWCLVATSLREVCNLSFKVELPKITKKNKVLPEPEEIISIIKGTSVELPCLLAMWLSFSMSEIRGLTCTSVKGDYICINQVVVDVNNEAIVKKDAKTETRIRKQRMPQYIKDLILETESYKNYLKDGKDRFLIDMTREQIRQPYIRALNKQGIELSFHDLRHYFASIMLTKLNVPEKVVQEEGGWKTDHIMKTVYSNTFSNSRNEADAVRDAYFNSIIQG